MNPRLTDEFEIVERWDEPGRLLVADLEADPDPSGAMNYLRVEMEGETRGRVTRA